MSCWGVAAVFSFFFSPMSDGVRITVFFKLSFVSNKVQGNIENKTQKKQVLHAK